MDLFSLSLEFLKFVGAEATCGPRFLLPSGIVEEASNNWVQQEYKEESCKNQLCLILTHDDFLDEKYQVVESYLTKNNVKIVGQYTMDKVTSI